MQHRGLACPAERVRRTLEHAIADHADLTLQQFNVLRILRGAGADGLPTLEVAQRMLEPSPGTTRMMDRLERKGLIESPEYNRPTTGPLPHQHSWTRSDRRFGPCGRRLRTGHGGLVEWR